jgi:hypothetical protein
MKFPHFTVDADGVLQDEQSATLYRRQVKKLLARQGNCSYRKLLRNSNSSHASPWLTVAFPSF